uniref:BTB domain-containing protein n=1 Tax=Arundo donax TaxID=35708 RepID=A0A0A9DWW3_ARUDO
MEASRTLSVFIPEKVQGTHVFDVFGYNLLRGKGVETHITSGTFSVAGYNWIIRFYPDGSAPRFKDYISVHLELFSKAAKVHASIDLRLVDLFTGLSSSVFSRTLVFNQDGQGNTTPPDGCFKLRSEFESSPYLRDNHLRIECVVTVVKELGVPKTKSFPKIDMPPSDLATQLGKLLQAEEGSDVTFSVGEETFSAHRFFLATRSPVFKAEFCGPMRETGTQLISIKDMQPYVFKALLHFIYTDSLPALDDLEGDDRSEMIRHLLVAADRYAMDRLKLICQSVLCNGLDVQNVASTLALADQHHCAMLKDACIEFMSSSRMDDIVATQGFVNLKRDCPSVLVDAFVKMSIIRKA